MLDSIYRMTLNYFETAFFGVKTLRFYHIDSTSFLNI